MFSLLKKPEYLLNPIQIFRRIFNKNDFEKDELIDHKLPWGTVIQINPYEKIGKTLYNANVFELEVSETLWRLLDAGNKVIDLGANIGYMTSIMALRIGSAGTIKCFEPHPKVYERLSFNVNRWKELKDVPAILTFPVAISDSEGLVNMYMSGDYFEMNQGIASIDFYHEHGSPITVPMEPLMNFVNDDEFIDMLKIDVEGHEAVVFSGCRKLLERHQVRDILFEDLGESLPTRATDILTECGYTIFYLQKQMFNVKLCELGSEFNLPVHQVHNFLATIDPERAIARMAKGGWQVYNS